MTRRKFGWMVIFGAVVAAAACVTETKLTELERAKSADLDVVLLSPHEAIKHGQDSFVLEFRAANGTLVDVGDVKATSTMPMPGQPMFGSLNVKKSNVPGRYDVDAKFDMAGTWRTTIEWQAPRPGSVTFSGAIQ
jgi:YtkA-like